MHSPGKNTGVDCHARLQGIFLTQGSNLCLLGFLHRWAGSLPLVPAEGEGARADLRGRNSKQRVEADRQRGELTCTTRALKSQGRKHGFPKAERRADIISVLHVCLGFVNLARFPLSVFQDVIETGFQGFHAALGSEDLWGVKGLPTGFPWLCGPLLSGPSTPDHVWTCLALPVRSPSGRNSGRACVCSGACVLCLLIRKTL